MKKEIKKKLVNPIEEYFAHKEGNKEYLISREIFKASEDVDIKTDLEREEIGLITTLQYNNQILKNAGLSPVYEKFLTNYMRLKISLNRQSRKEFVDMNKGDKTDDVLKGMADLSTIEKTKK
jgi:hypothetical protein